MNSLKRLKAEGRARREAQEFMIDVLNLMAMSYAIELHEEHGFGAERIARLTDAAIRRVHSTIGRYEGEYTETALESWCRTFGFIPKIGLDERGAVKFCGSSMKKQRARRISGLSASKKADKRSAVGEA